MSDDERDDEVDDENDDDQLKVVNASFAWAQTFVGAILSGFSVFHLCLKLLAVPASKVMEEWMNAYVAVRDFIVLPLVWLEFEVSPTDKSMIVLCLVLMGAFARATAAVVLPTVFSAALLPYTFGFIAGGGFGSAIRWLLGFFIVCTIVIPILVRNSDDMEARIWARFVLLNVVATVSVGAMLLLLNVGTS